MGEPMARPYITPVISPEAEGRREISRKAKRDFSLRFEMTKGRRFEMTRGKVLNEKEKASTGSATVRAIKTVAFYIEHPGLRPPLFQRGMIPLHE